MRPEQPKQPKQPNHPWRPTNPGNAMDRSDSNRYGGAGGVSSGNARRLSSALGDAVTDLYEKGGESAKASVIWGEAVGPVGRRHTRGIYVKESGQEGVPPTLYVYLDSNAFVYEYGTDHILYEQRLANLGFPVRELVPRLSRSAGAPTPSRPYETPSGLMAGEPKARPLDELQPLDEGSEQWARDSVAGLPKELGDAVYRAMTSSMRRNRDEGRT